MLLGIILGSCLEDFVIKQIWHSLREPSALQCNELRINPFYTKNLPWENLCNSKLSKNSYVPLTSDRVQLERQLKNADNNCKVYQLKGIAPVKTRQSKLTSTTLSLKILLNINACMKTVKTASLYLTGHGNKDIVHRRRQCLVHNFRQGKLS